MTKSNKLDKSDSIISKRTTRYLKRTIKKNYIEILNDKKYIKFLNESLKYMNHYALLSYNYNNFLLNKISNLNNAYNNLKNEKLNELTTEITTQFNNNENNENDIFDDQYSYI